MGRMQNKFGLSIVGALLLMVVAALAGAIYAGPLDPPGTPGPTQDNLIFQPAGGCAGFPITLGSPGSYKLAQNITMPASCAKDGIDVSTADPVDLDLSGFKLGGNGVGLKGIKDTSGGTNLNLLSVEDGALMDWTTGGIDGGSRTTSFANLQLSNNLGISVAFASGTLTHSTITGGATGVEAQNGSITGNTIFSMSGRGIFIIGSGGAAVSGNTIRSALGDGILLDSAGNIISGNAISNSAPFGIYLTPNASGSHIEGNTIRGTTSTGDGGDGIQVWSPATTVVGNTSSGNSRFGIQFESTAGNGQISGNTVSNNTSTGISMVSSNAKIADNSVSGNGADGIGVNGTDNAIDGNNASGNFFYGIDIATSAALRSTITNNTANKNGSGGIYTEYGATAVTGNTASKNTGTGIAIPNGGARIDNNHADHNTVYGFQWFGNAGADTGVCIVIRNTADSNGTSPFTTAQNYPNFAGNGCDVAPITTAAAMTNPVGNISE